MANKFKTGDRVRLTQRWALLTKGRMGSIVYTMAEKYPKMPNPPEEYGCNFDGFGEAVWLKPEHLELVDYLVRSENAQNTGRNQQDNKSSKTKTKTSTERKDQQTSLNSNKTTEEGINPFSDLSPNTKADEGSDNLEVS